MDDRTLIYKGRSKRITEQTLSNVMRLHDAQVNVIPTIVRVEGEWAIQISRFDGEIMAAWQQYCDQRVD